MRNKKGTGKGGEMKLPDLRIVLVGIGVCLMLAGALMFAVSGGETGTGAQDNEQDNEIQYVIPLDAVFRDQNAYCIYNIKDEKLNDYWEAEAFCEERGGHLAVINSEEENDFLYSYIRDNGLSVSFFGYSDDVEEGKWEWVNGSSNYENWADGQPNNGIANSNKREENFAEFSKKDEDGTWNDAPFGSNTYHFICEWEMETNGEYSSDTGTADAEIMDDGDSDTDKAEEEDGYDENEELDLGEDTETDEIIANGSNQYLKTLSNGELQYTSPAGDIRYIFPECHPDPDDEPYLYYSLSQDGEREECVEVHYHETGLNISIVVSSLKDTSIEEYFENKKSDYGREYEFSVVRENECVYSYYLFEGETIVYIRAVIKNDTLYETEYEYPTLNRTVCDEIVEEYSGQDFLGLI